jgi:uncharacterized membrane protein YphA (DoxX/SURF4 family)
MQTATHKAVDNSYAGRPGKGTSIALWIAQGLLAALFLFAGIMKFVMSVEQMTKGSPLSGSFLHFIGVMEILGGIGMIVPALLRIRPILTPIAASGLVIIMIGATVLTLPMGAGALFPFFTGLLALFVAYGRFRLRPIPPKHATAVR